MAKILLLEDDQISAMMFQMLLEESGHTVYYAPDTDAARVLLNLHTIEFLFSDWSVGGSLTSAQFAQEVKQKYPSAKLVFITGYSSDALASNIEDIEPVTVFSKPVDFDGLIRSMPSLP